MSDMFAATWYQKTTWVAIFLVFGGAVFGVSLWTIRHPRRAFSLWYRYGWPFSHFDSPVPGPTSSLYGAFLFGARVALFGVAIIVLIDVIVIIVT